MQVQMQYPSRFSQYPIEKIVIMGANWVGDMIMTGGLIKSLLLRHPKAKIDIVAPPATSSVAKLMEGVNQVWEINSRHGHLDFGERRRVARLLHMQNYDLAISTQRALKATLVPWLAKIPLRWGLRSEGRFFLTHSIPFSGTMRTFVQILSLGFPDNPSQISRHTTEELSHFWPTLKAPELHDDNLPEIWRLVQNAGKKHRIALCPGSEFGSAKRWITEYWGTLARKLVHRDWQVVILSNPKDAALSEEIARHEHAVVNLVGQTNLEQALAVLAKCDVAVSNDSGLMHAAAALGCGVVGIYGSTPSGMAPPHTHKSEICVLDPPLDCMPCRQRTCPLNTRQCMRDLNPETILAAIDRLIQKK